MQFSHIDLPPNGHSKIPVNKMPVKTPNQQIASANQKLNHLVKSASSQDFTDVSAVPDLVQAAHRIPAPENPFDRILHASIAQTFGGFSPMALTEAWFDWFIHLSVSPMRIHELAIAATAQYDHVTNVINESFSGHEICHPCERTLPHDKRFRHESWQKWPYALYAESYLAIERFVDEATKDVHGATKHHLDLLNFAARQRLDMLAPSNFPLINPEVLQKTIDTKGMNIFLGSKNFMDDMYRMLRAEKPAGINKFKPGETVALTEGEVVLRTHLAEVIQYHPTTDNVKLEPIVIVPAWIMKYYILDLRQQNSLVKHLVDQGFTVFMISWHNPDAEDKDTSFDQYRSDGVMPAIDIALKRTGAKKAHCVGYCIGGTLLAVAAAAMTRDKDERIQSLTFLAAQIDFEDAGELKIFIDESQLAVLDDMMWEQGALEASQMVGTFNMLRSNDLIWSRLIHHYLMAEPERVSDISAWSSDATRMSYKMHSEYLHSFYQRNDLAAGRYKVDGKPITLQDISLPIFAVGTEWDHVAPWRSVYKLHRLSESEITFILTNGGHNQGIIAPPKRLDRHYRIATTPVGHRHRDADSWVKASSYNQGSWWPSWFDWLTDHSSKEVPVSINIAPMTVGSLGSAPGTYVYE